MKIRIALLILVYFLCSNSVEYIYKIENENFSLYMHQKNNTISLNESLHLEHSMLSSQYNPAYVRFSPQNNAFSFIDNGRIHIKKFEKRSAMSLEPSLSLFAIRSVDWLNQDILLVNAVYKKRFGIFYIDLMGNITDFIIHKVYDLVFPQVYKKNTYYISTITNKNESIYGIGCYFKNKFYELISLQNKILSFLHMIDDQNGFVLSCSPESMNQEIIVFDINQLICFKNQWSLKTVCSFSVPQNFLNPKSADCFFEGMLPLLPKYKKNCIYFLDVEINKNGYKFLYKKYNMQTGKISEQNEPNLKNKIEIMK